MKTKVFKKRISYPGQGSYSVINVFNGVRSQGDSSITSGASAVLDSTVSYGENLPNYLRLIRLGLDATTPMQGTVQRASFKPGMLATSWSYAPDNGSNSYYLRVGSITGNLSTTPIIPSGTIPSSHSKAESLALARFNEKVAEVNRQFQGGVFFAELTKTLHGLRHPAEALFGGIRKYHTAVKKLRRRMIPRDFETFRGKRRRLVAQAFSKAATGLWLEHSFHWLPLTYDIQGAVSALKSSFERLPSEFVKASAYDEQLKESFTNSHLWGVLSTLEETVDVYSASVRFYGRVRVGTRLPYWPDSKALGYDYRSFIPTVWELIPYSWAIDYFTNIGDILYGLSYGGQDVMWAARGIRRSVRRLTKATGSAYVPVPPLSHHTVSYSTSGVTSEVVGEKAFISRASYTGSYVPSFEWSVPGLSLKWLNLGAAFLQRSLDRRL